MHNGFSCLYCMCELLLMLRIAIQQDTDIFSKVSEWKLGGYGCTVNLLC